MLHAIQGGLKDEMGALEREHQPRGLMAAKRDDRAMTRGSVHKIKVERSLFGRWIRGPVPRAACHRPEWVLACLTGIRVRPLTRPLPQISHLIIPVPCSPLEIEKFQDETIQIPNLPILLVAYSATTQQTTKMATIGSLIFCNDCGNLLPASKGSSKNILQCECCGAENQGE